MRHSERMDQVASSDVPWKETPEGQQRPHDSPLTTRGKGMAVRLGAYLRRGIVRPISDEHVVILASPLTRCVETAHGIAEGLQVPTPIFIEDTLVEGPHWIGVDLRHWDFSNGLPQPLFHDADFHKAHTSPLVQPGRPSLARIDMCYSNGRVHERPNVHVRVQLAAKKLVASNEFDGNTVILVAHGQTTVSWCNALARLNDRSEPQYTAFTELLYDTGKASYVVAGDLFSTPHLMKSNA